MNKININRRKFNAALGSAVAFGGLAPGLVIAQPKTKIRIGYLHVLSVDGHMWIAKHLGAFEKEGLEVELREFNSGVEIFQAMIGGSLDVLTTGGVLSNFPARNQGKVFLLNNIEQSVGQVWVNGGAGINTIADLKGKKVVTTRGTTAHLCLHEGLKTVGLDSAKDVEIINQRMGDAVTSFIAGAAPAVATWVPFNTAIKAKMPTAKKLFDAGKMPQAWIVDGWAARNDFHDKNKDALRRVISAWTIANDYIMAKPQEALDILHKSYYANLKRDDVDEMYNAAKFYSTQEWAKLYADGTAAKWLNQVTQFNVNIGAIEKAIYADKYFDTSLYADVMKKRKA
ncbi:ABC transporter substrate-binding protein [Lacisediminimonas sp.]|uniref:ABC transporter substrate-binding protein n=1 Tax=Lacisediminimonas sp. TaxID=3060582 RepID=UPI0027282832|nr:ABC transporter substrate-binding protein [Lacisediminimonas sp.]MDO8298724.1 ABC transporter substrate-binding protein [Lacisediminimonas sp.]